VTFAKFIKIQIAKKRKNRKKRKASSCGCIEQQSDPLNKKPGLTPTAIGDKQNKTIRVRLPQ
jgi:hypothetical protein